MSTTIFTAPQYDPEKARKRRQTIVAILCAVIIVAGVLYIFRYWPEERRVDHFFAALENKDYKQAYGIWLNDPNWEQHANKYTQYPFDEFYRDWGPGGEWGAINSYKIEGATTPRQGGSGVIVVVTINGRAEPARIWVEKKAKTLTWSPY